MVQASYLLLLGEPDWQGMLIYALIFLASLGGFVFVVCFIYVKVFRGGRESAVTISPDATEEHAGGKL